MKINIGKEIIVIILGSLSLLLLAGKPYILDLIEPAKSIGQVIGENAKDLIESLKVTEEINTSNSKRDIYSSVIIILAFISLIGTLILSINLIQTKNKRWYGICGLVLAALAIILYIVNLAIGLIGLLVIAIFVVLFVVLIDTN